MDTRLLHGWQVEAGVGAWNPTQRADGGIELVPDHVHIGDRAGLGLRLSVLCVSSCSGQNVSLSSGSGPRLPLAGAELLGAECAILTSPHLHLWGPQSPLSCPGHVMAGRGPSEGKCAHLSTGFREQAEGLVSGANEWWAGDVFALPRTLPFDLS